MPNPRAAKVAERIHEIVASLVISRLKDPRLDMVTITDVRVSGDLQHATIFYTVLGGEKRLKEAGRGLASAKGFLRSQVGQQLGLRLTPSLEFVADALPETARSFEDALVAARFRDQQIAKAAEGAEWAAGEDPYRKDEDEADADLVEADSADAGDTVEAGDTVADEDSSDDSVADDLSDDDALRA